MDKRIKEIIAEAINNNSADIQKKDFDKIYKELRYYRPQLTKTFIHAGINPWDYFRDLPVGLARKVNIPSLEIKANVEIIETHAFSNCSIKNLLFSGKFLTTIQDGAFENNLMTEVELPESLTYLGLKVFAGCESLRRINIPKNCVISKNLFVGCLNLERVRYDGSMDDFENSRGSLFLRGWADDSGIEEVVCTDGIINVFKNKAAGL